SFQWSVFRTGTQLSGYTVRYEQCLLLATSVLHRLWISSCLFPDFWKARSKPPFSLPLCFHGVYLR
ncbi:MAG TPA: hypothetical protein VF421_19960, partial [Niabella sp.]